VWEKEGNITLRIRKYRGGRRDKKNRQFKKEGPEDQKKYPTLSLRRGTRQNPKLIEREERQSRNRESQGKPPILGKKKGRGLKTIGYRRRCLRRTFLVEDEKKRTKSPKGEKSETMKKGLDANGKKERQ